MQEAASPPVVFCASRRSVSRPDPDLSARWPKLPHELRGRDGTRRRFRFFLSISAGAAPLASAVLLALQLHDGEASGPERSAGRAASLLTPKPPLRPHRGVHPA
jgi:hypothetical protein